MGHRGVPTEAPENSLASFRRAVEAGVDAIELDVQLTTDGALAVVHDWDLERVASSSLVVERAAWPQIHDLELLHADGKPSRQRIPQLRDVFAAVPSSLPINVELKHRKSDPDAFLDTICPLLDERPHCWVSSFDWDLLRQLRRRRPRLALAPLTSRRRHRFEPTAEALDALALHCATHALSGAMLRRARRANRPVLVYTVDTIDEAQALFARGVSGIFTNRARRLIKGLR